MRIIIKIKVHPKLIRHKDLMDAIEKAEKEHIVDKKSIIQNLSSNDLLYRLTGLDETQAEAFSHNEKMLLSLLCSGYTREQIAVILFSTQESIRVRTIRLKKKTENLGFLMTCFDS